MRPFLRLGVESLAGVSFKTAGMPDCPYGQQGVSPSSAVW